MATKKGAPKKAAKAAKPAKKATVKKTATTKTTKTQTKKTAIKKPVVSKAPAKKVAPAKNAAPKKAAKPEKKVSKKITEAAAPNKEAAAPKKLVDPKKKAAPSKQAQPKTVAPVEKPAVEAPSQNEVRPDIKPLKKSGEKAEKPEKAESKKPVAPPKTSTDKSVKYEPDFTKSVLDTSTVADEPQKPTMRYSDSELTEFRELIQRKLDTAKKELNYLQGLITRKDESGDLDEGRYMTMEDGSMSMEREQLSQMASRQIQFIDHLEKAIMRIENKTYGICRVTGKLIDKARLRAVPHATLSIEAKQMMNK